MTRSHPEQILQRQVAQFLALALGGSAWFSTIPLGGGGKVRGAILRGLGTKDGLPDILVVDSGRALWIELKAKRGTVSPAQRECHAALHRARSSTAICRSLGEVIAFLHHEGVPLKVAHTGTAG